jgi:integrase
MIAPSMDNDTSGFMKKPLPIDVMLKLKVQEKLRLSSVKQSEIATGAVPGLKLVAYRNGGMAYVFRFKDGMTRKRDSMTLADASDMTFAEAIACAVKLRADVQSGRSPRQSMITVGNYFDQIFYPWVLINKASARAYLSWFNLYIRPVLGELMMADVRPFQLTNLIDHLPSRFAGSTKNKVASVMKSLFRHAFESGVVERNAASVLRLKATNNARQRVASMDELHALYKAMAAETEQLPCLLIRLLLASGIRLNEALTAEFRDINYEKLVLRLRGQVTKNKKSREVPISDEMMSVITVLTAMRRNEFLFPGRDGNHMARPARALKRILQRAGIEGLSFHDCRRTAASIAVNSGIPILDTSRFLGHSDCQVTSIHYAVLRDERLHALAAVISDVLRAAAGTAP